MVVDGPKGNLCEKSRYQALPRLKQYLSVDHAVFLDDIHREDEYKIAQMWRDEFNEKLVYHFEKGSMAILRPIDTAKDRTIT